MNWIGSPNYTSGRGGTKIDRVVIHWMVGTLGSTDSVFQDKISQTSAHYGIEDGVMHQYVNESDTAYHAGLWAMNLRSIGIEHSADPNRPASAMTIETSAKLVADICERYGIPCDRSHILKHSEVPYPTQCCGTIPINQIVTKANAILKGEEMSEVGLNQARINAFAIAGRNGYDGRPNALKGECDDDLRKNHVGRESNADQQSWYSSREGKNYREVIEPAVYKERDNLKKQLADTTAKLTQVSTQANLSASLQEQVDDLTKKNAQLVNDQQAAQATGNAFIQWIGGLFNSKKG